MGRKVKTAVLAAFCAGLIWGCGTNAAGGGQPVRLQAAAETAPADLPETAGAVMETDSETLEIGEKMFLTQINDIYNNFHLYQDKTVIVEGIYQEFVFRDGTGTAPVVFRYGPGCCGNDGWGGFLLRYDGEFPAEDSWIRVTGGPELVKNEAGYTDLYLNVESLVVKEERGEEYMLQ